jgi:S-adenosylmethionine hydrolase
MNIDMSAIFDIDHNFVTANFNAGAGYTANVLKYFPRYSLHRPKTIIKKSFAKATSRKNLQ